VTPLEPRAAAETTGAVAPRSARTNLLRFTFALSFITFLDRVAISSAAPAIRDELHLSPSQLGWAFSAFTIAYAAFEIPTGRLGDLFGTRRVLTRIVLWWSAFTALTGAAWNLPSLVVTRFLFGVGEAGAYPNISKTFARWLPRHERGFAHGLVFFGSRIGGALAPPLVVLVTGVLGWRAAFWIFGAIGVVWSAAWWWWFRDRPEEHPSVSPAELREIVAGRDDRTTVIPWRSLLDRNMIVLCLMYFCVIYGLYFYLTWLPTYFKEARGFTAAQAAGLASMVLITGGVATIVGGKLTDYLVQHHGRRVARSIGVISLPLSGIAFIAAARTSSPALAAVMFAVATAGADLTLAAVWAVCHDIGETAAGTVTGMMNTFGNIGGAVSPLVVGYMLESGSSWAAPLMIGGVIYIVGGMLTLFIDPDRPLLHSR
jgi:ACS family glucarate transporter-like MFS transporter